MAWTSASRSPRRPSARSGGDRDRRRDHRPGRHLHQPPPPDRVHQRRRGRQEFSIVFAARADGGELTTAASRRRSLGPPGRRSPTATCTQACDSASTITLSSEPALPRLKRVSPPQRGARSQAARPRRDRRTGSRHGRPHSESGSRPGDRPRPGPHRQARSSDRRSTARRAATRCPEGTLAQAAHETPQPGLDPGARVVRDKVERALVDPSRRKCRAPSIG